MGADIMDGGGVTTVSLNGGTIDMAGHLIGSVSIPIDTVSLANGTLDNITQINAGALTINSGVTLDASLPGPFTSGESYALLTWTTLTENATFAAVNLPALARRPFMGREQLVREWNNPNRS